MPLPVRRSNVDTITQGTPVYGPSDCSSQECDIFGVDPHIKTPYMENYNINIQQQLGSKTVLQVGYVGSPGHRLLRFYDINQPSNAAVTAADCPYGIAPPAPPLEASRISAFLASLAMPA